LDYVPKTTIVYNNSIYALYDIETSWTYAKVLCEKMGGHLATITSAVENNKIVELIDRSPIIK